MSDTMPRNYEETLTVDISKVDSATPRLGLSAANLNFGSALGSTILISEPSTFSGVRARSVTKHPSGECNLNFGGQIIVPPGNILLLTVADNSAPGRFKTFAITVTWFEL